jgi:anti-sigma factor RsiW
MHDTYLELAAAALDFELSPRERWALDEHLGSCPACRQRAAMLRTDARAVAALPAFALPVAGYNRVEKRLRSSGRSPIGTLRLVVVAALFAIAALGAVQVGAEVIRRLEQERDLSQLVPDVPRPSASTPAVSPAPAEPGQFAAGTVVDVVSGGLRVRTLPTVDNATSAKFEPLLGAGAQLRILEGPVTADGYDWYRVEAIGSPQTGWVSAGDHDGTPWIADPTVGSPSGVLSPEQAALTLAIRPDAAVACEPRAGRLPARSTLGIECRLRTAIVARVGVYGYKDADDALATHVERMAAEGVRRMGGDCATGTEGDLRWGPDGPAGGRIGCFLDANGSANIRMTCGSIGIGVLGRQDQMAALWDWTWTPADGSAETVPGLCRRP